MLLGLPPHIAAKVCGHSTVDTTMGYAAIYPEDVIAHHRAFIARRRAERPSEEYFEVTVAEWDEFLPTRTAENGPRNLWSRSRNPLPARNACFSQLTHVCAQPSRLLAVEGRKNALSAA